MNNGFSPNYSVPLTAITWKEYMRDCGTVGYKEEKLKAF